MVEYVQNLSYTDEEKVLTYCKNIVKAVEKTREVAAIVNYSICYD